MIISEYLAITVRHTGHKDVAYVRLGPRTITKRLLHLTPEQLCNNRGHEIYCDFLVSWNPQPRQVPVRQPNADSLLSTPIQSRTDGGVGPLVENYAVEGSVQNPGASDQTHPQMRHPRHGLASRARSRSPVEHVRWGQQVIVTPDIHEEESRDKPTSDSDEGFDQGIGRSAKGSARADGSRPRTRGTASGNSSRIHSEGRSHPRRGAPLNSNREVFTIPNSSSIVGRGTRGSATATQSRRPETSGQSQSRLPRIPLSGTRPSARAEPSRGAREESIVISDSEAEEATVGSSLGGHGGRRSAGGVRHPRASRTAGPSRRKIVAKDGPEVIEISD